jgi:hypothetical protein
MQKFLAEETNLIVNNHKGSLKKVTQFLLNYFVLND